ncbi:MAG: hypothetical protein R6W91_04430 [Thermoplasmata archaeon]
MVPEPHVVEHHDFNVATDEETQTEIHSINNERWGLDISHGGVVTKIEARNMTQETETWVDYQMNIQYLIGDTLYIAQSSLCGVSFLFANDPPVKTYFGCCDFELTYSPIRYNGTVPEMDCNISFIGIQVYPGTSLQSTYDLTMIHHIRADWERTDVKVEALLDFSNTKFYDSSNVEYNAGEHFTAEIHYSMLVGIAHMGCDGFILPAGYTNTSMEYNLTLDNGSPLTVSKLMMKNNYFVHNGTGTHEMMGYSVMSCDLNNPIANVIHGFPNLTYKDTQSLQSDPEVTVFHDRVTSNEVPFKVETWKFTSAIGLIVGISIAAILMIKHRRNKGQ